MKTKTFKLIFPMEGVLPACIVDLTDKEDRHWIMGHLYQAPVEFEINANYIKEVNKKELSNG